MSGIARMERERVRRFNHCWEDLYRAFPAARAAAVAEMGKAVRKDVAAQVTARGVDDLFGHVRSWQALRLGSRGGYAAVSPGKQEATDRFGRVHTYQGKPVNASQVTRWLERGHGARQPAAGGKRKWSLAGRARIDARTGKRYVPGRRFYSWARRQALDHALKAADKVLCQIADEIDY